MDWGPKAGLALRRPVGSSQLLSIDPSRVSALPAACPVFWLPGKDVRGTGGVPEKQEATLGGPSQTGRWARALLHLSGEQLRGSWGRTRGPSRTHCPWPGNQEPSALLRLHVLLEG